eukprot:760945-Hanusia_phi.AAC.3
MRADGAGEAEPSTAADMSTGDVNLANSDFEDFHVPGGGDEVLYVVRLARRLFAVWRNHETRRCFLRFSFLLLSVQAPDASEGDIVPREKKDFASEVVQGASGLLVIGSSVSVEEAAERSCEV